MEITAIESRSEAEWLGGPIVNLRTITSVILAVALMVSIGGVYAAEQAGEPYTGPDTPVMTTG